MKNLTFLAVTVSALLLVYLQPALAQFYFDGYESLPEKKSHQGMADFTNALNGAARLRYGKRAFIPGLSPKFRAYDWLPKFQATDKRAAASSLDSMPQFLQTLNGAERLRFG